jgi:hypothetical protein
MLSTSEHGDADRPLQGWTTMPSQRRSLLATLTAQQAESRHRLAALRAEPSGKWGSVNAGKTLNPTATEGGGRRGLPQYRVSIAELRRFDRYDP